MKGFIEIVANSDICKGMPSGWSMTGLFRLSDINCVLQEGDSLILNFDQGEQKFIFNTTEEAFDFYCELFEKIKEAS